MKYIMIITCSSFTVIVLLFVLLSNFGLTSELSGPIALQLFAISATIAVLLLALERLEDRFEINSFVLDAVLRILICYLVVYAEGCLFGMLDAGWETLVTVSPILLPAFVITYAVSYFSLVSTAKKINRDIRRKK